MRAGPLRVNIKVQDEIHIYPSMPTHLEGLPVFALPSPLPQKGLLFLFLLLLLQRPDVLLKTNEGVLFVHVCEHITNNIKEVKNVL